MQNSAKQKLITFNDVKDDDFPLFKSDKERIKYMSRTYRNMSISKAFSVFYNVDIDKDVKSNKAINNVSVIEIGSIYNGIVKTFSKNEITFELPGCKYELISKENLYDSYDNINNYLLTHANTIMFEIKSKKDNKYYVSILDAYYKLWLKNINNYIQYENEIDVHIDKLVTGGYMCHTNIDTINELTGKQYTHFVFIPGSNIVLNIERDFDKWVGQDVSIIPQKIVDFRDFKTGNVGKSLVGSRKRVLQIYGMNNIHDLYNKFMLVKSNDNVKYENESFDGIVTGIINSANKTGIFVELDNLYITGLMPIDSSDLLDYKPGDNIKVKIKEFEIQEGKDPFLFNKRGKLIKANVRPVFELA